MRASVVNLDPAADCHEALHRAAEVLASGGLVVFPTETVYGLAANAAETRAVTRLRAVKGRVADHPFTVHIPRRSDAADYVTQPSPLGRRLMNKGWPGPLTLLFAVPEPEKTGVHPRLAPAGREAIFRARTVGLRCPDDPMAFQVLAAAGVPVIASSANRSGRPPPLDVDAVLAELADDVDLVLDAGRTRYAKASTIVSVNGGGYRVVREGVFDARTIRRLAALNILFVCTGNTCRSPMAEGLCRHMLAERLGCSVTQLHDRNVAVTSCGTAAFDGAPASEHAVQVCHKRDIDITGHRSRRLSADLIHSADYVFTMTARHHQAVLDLVPDAIERTRALDPSGDVADPLGGGEEEYRVCADRIARHLAERLKEVDV